MYLLPSGLEPRQELRAEKPGEYQVQQKYFANTARDPNEFLAVLTSWDGNTVNCWVPVSEFANVNIKDLIVVPDEQRPPSWHLIWSPDVKVIHSFCPVEWEEISIGYMTNPKRFGSEVYYVAKLLQGWIIIPYPVAVAYFDRARIERGSDYYRVLKVPKKASTKRIRTAYRRLARQYHPDSAPAGKEHEYAAHMCMLNEAWSVLGNESKRQTYDTQRPQSGTLKRWPGGGPGTLKVLVEKRGQWWIATQIASFKRRERVQSYTVPVQSLVFGHHSAIVFYGDAGGGVPEGRCTIESDHFPFSAALNHYRDSLHGHVTLEIHERMRATWPSGGGGPTLTWETLETELRWPTEVYRKILEIADIVTQDYQAEQSQRREP